MSRATLIVVSIAVGTALALSCIAPCGELEYFPPIDDAGQTADGGVLPGDVADGSGIYSGDGSVLSGGDLTIHACMRLCPSSYQSAPLSGCTYILQGPNNQPSLACRYQGRMCSGCSKTD
jgi:hypothetical protein